MEYRPREEVMDHARSTATLRSESSLAPPTSNEEHVALLVDIGKFDQVRRKDDLLAEGVAAVFGLASGQAELLGLSFHAGKFTPSQTLDWLAERGFKPLLIVLNSAKTRVR